jgi:hypothetical protein
MDFRETPVLPLPRDPPTRLDGDFQILPSPSTTQQFNQSHVPDQARIFEREPHAV